MPYITRIIKITVTGIFSKILAKGRMITSIINMFNPVPGISFLIP